MTQDDKELLLKDLSARLPYGVKIYFGGIPKLLTSITVKLGYTEILVEGEYSTAAYCDCISTYNNKEYLQEEITKKCKPYLRPMSSMTKEEEEEYNNIDNRAYFCPKDYAHIPAKDRIDWLLKNYFDFRGLIPKGLAIEVTKENNPYERE